MFRGVITADNLQVALSAGDRRPGVVGLSAASMSIDPHNGCRQGSLIRSGQTRAARINLEGEADFPPR